MSEPESVAAPAFPVRHLKTEFTITFDVFGAPAISRSSGGGQMFFPQHVRFLVETGTEGALRVRRVSMSGCIAKKDGSPGRSWLADEWWMREADTGSWWPRGAPAFCDEMLAVANAYLKEHWS